MSTTFSHSVGLMLIDSNAVADNREYTFKLTGSDVTELYGWGMNGGPDNVPAVTNPPMGEVTTVYVEDSEASRAKVAELIAEHKERYGECQLRVYPEDSELAKWVQGGMRGEDDEPTSLDLGVSSKGHGGTMVGGERMEEGPGQSDDEPADASTVDSAEVPDGTVEDVKAWVGDDPARAQAALDAERATKNRVTLVDHLEGVSPTSSGEAGDTAGDNAPLDEEEPGEPEDPIADDDDDELDDDDDEDSAASWAPDEDGGQEP